MAVNFEQVYRDLCAWVEARGVRVRERRLKAEKAGEFDGVSFTMNSSFTPEERTYYFAHALGSVVRWSVSKPNIQAIFDELRDAKKKAEANRLERAIKAYRAFEIESSEFAVWLLRELGHANVVPSYTNFMRADLDALTEFHRSGVAPVWRDFFPRWNMEVAEGRRHVVPFTAKAIPAFSPVEIETQEIIQERDGKP
jgi:23S rRNA G2069 N7-methylase RlmK/C1962 C5-methylase RlmI